MRKEKKRCSRKGVLSKNERRHDPIAEEEG